MATLLFRPFVTFVGIHEFHTSPQLVLRNLYDTVKVTRTNREGIMNITEYSERDSALIDALVDVWEASVKTTHDFLTVKGIAEIKQYVPQALAGIPVLAVAHDEQGKPVGFMSTDGGKLEMLFLAPESRGTGIGRALLEYGIREHGVRELAVNEQNPQARGFYEHMGFVVTDRSEIDDQGGPYPILYMRLQAK